jgi:lysophospholipase L1-like esterase
MSARNPGQTLANLALAGVSLLLTFILLEVAARLYLSRLASDSAFREYASFEELQERLQPKLTPHRYLGHYPTPNYARGENRHNALGYRGEEILQPKPATEFRIVCLGGSTTYTSEVEDHRLTYPALLERELRDHGYGNVRVVNAGAPGWSSWESLINFEFRVLDLDPDLIIVYHAINDVHSRLVWPPQAYQGDNSGRRAQVERVFVPGLLERSTLLRILMIRAGWSVSHSALLRSLDRAPDTYYGDLFRSQKQRGVYPEGIFEDVSAREMLDRNPPIYFRRNIENIVEIARMRGARTLLATFAYSSAFSDEPRVASDEYRFALDQANELLRDIANERKVALFDFARAFPQEPEYYTDGRHVNEKGAHLKAQLFAQHLVESGLLSATAPRIETSDGLPTKAPR